MKRLFGDPLQRLRPEERAAFLEEQNVARFYRAVAFARFSAVVMVVLLVLVDVLDVARLDPFAMRISLVGHLLLLGVTIGFLVYARRDPVNPAKGTTRRQRVATHVLLLCLYVFLWNAFLMTFLRNGNPSIHHIGVFSVAVALPFARLAPVLFLGDLALFFLALGLRPGTDIDFYLSGAVTNGLAMLFARLMLEGRIRDFLARRTIEIQARDRSEVLAIAAHDLKNPLNGIKGYSEMILEDPEMPPEEREDALRRILASAARMHELVRNLLDINALEDGKLALNVAPCDLGEVVRGVGESYAPAALAKRQTLLVLAASAPLVADRAVLVQVTDNLVSNAVKYSR
ncbi:MAG: HAMP domain-containing histidine kinase, partial [Acidobacteria bacterium]|nr:HAMP domain-containing histidine kinase [Acidobacteriota bacterium]